MTRSELVQMLVARHPALTRQDIKRLVVIFFDQITSRLVSGGRVELRGFGSFSTRDRVARVGRNPKTGSPTNVAARRAVHFSAGKSVRRLVDRV